MKKIICLFFALVTIVFADVASAQKMTLSKTNFSTNEKIVVHCSGFPEDFDCYVAISRKTDIDKENGIGFQTQSIYHQKEKVMEFDLIGEPGEYKLVLYHNLKPDAVGYLRQYVPIQKIPFTIGQPEITTTKKVYAPYEKIIVTCSGFEKYPYSWICIAEKSDPISSNGLWGNPRNGKVEYSGRRYGDYEIRAFLTNDHNLLKKVSFRIGNEDVNTKVSTKKLINPAEWPVVEFSGFPGNLRDKIYIVPVNGSIKDPFIYPRILNGQQKGKITLTPMSAGEYDILGFFNDEDIVRAKFRFTVGYASDFHKKAFYIGELRIDDLEKRSRQLPYKVKEWRLTNSLKEEINKREALLDKILNREEEIKQLNKEISNKGNGIELIKEKLADIENKENRHKRYYDISEQLNSIGPSRRELELIVGTGQKEREKSDWWNEREEKAQKYYEEKLKEIKEGELPGGYIFKLISEQKELDKEWERYVHSQLYYDKNYLESILEKKMKAISPFITKKESVRKNFLDPLLIELQDQDNKICDIEFELSKTRAELDNEEATPTIEEINIVSAGNVVFNAVWNLKPEIITLEKEMARLKSARDNAEKVKRDAFKTYFKAAEQTLIAGNNLGLILERNVYFTAGIEFTDAVIDIFLKGGIEGGLPGIVLASLKKFAEIYYEDWMSEHGPGYFGTNEDGSIAAEVNAQLMKELNLEIKDPKSGEYGLTTVTRTILDRSVKVAVISPTVDASISVLASSVEKMATLTELRTAYLERSLDKWKEVLSTSLELHGKIIARDFAQDLGKAFLKSLLDESEKNAAIDFCLKNEKSTLLFIPFNVAWQNFESIDATYQEYMQKYQAIIDNAKRDPKEGFITENTKEGFKITVNEPFYSKDKLEINMKVKDNKVVHKERISLNGEWTNFNKPHEFLFTVPESWFVDNNVQKKIPLLIQRNKKTNGWTTGSFQH